MKRFLFLLILILLCSCTQPEQEHVETATQPQIYFYNAVHSCDVWVRLEETETEYFLVPTDKQRRWDVEENCTYHISIRIVDNITAIQNGDCMERIERICESNDKEVLIDHKVVSITVYRDKGAFVYSHRTFD